MESNEYWRKRALKLEARANKKGEALQKQLKREYTKAAKAIREKVDSFYMRYAKEQGLSYAEAIKALSSKEAREWRKTIAEYVEEIKALPDGAAKSRLIAELDMRPSASQQDRLSTLAGQIDMEIDRLFIGAEQQMTATMTDVLEDGYYRKSFDLQQRAGVMSHIPRLSPEMVENVLTYPWSGADFSSRIWENKRKLLFNMRQTITQGLMQGQSIARMSKDLGDTLGKSYIVTERLVRTETNHFHAEADKGAYNAAGVEQYEYMATLDTRTSDVCASLDGKVFNVKDAQVGVNYPPMHPWCRSTTVEYDPEDAADWAASGEPMPKSTTYEEWKAAQDAADTAEVLYAKNNPYIINPGELPPAIYQFRNYDDYKTAVAEWRKTHDGSPYDFYVENSVWATSYLTDEQIERVKRFDATIAKLQSDYPLPAPHSERLYVGSYDSIDMYLNEIQRSRKDGGVAQAQFWFNPDENTAVIGFDPIGVRGTLSDDLLLREKKLAKGEILSSVLDDSPEGIAIHEWGHGYSDYISSEMVYSNPNAEAYWKWYKSLSKEDIEKGVSVYAATNRGEFEAECFAELLTGNPRPIAKKYGEYLEKCAKDARIRLEKYGADAIKSGMAGKIDLALDYALKRDTSSLKTIILPKQEYAHVMSELATNLTEAQKRQKVVSKAIGNYVYTVEIKGFGDYRVIGKTLIDEEAAKWWR